MSARKTKKLSTSITLYLFIVLSVVSLVISVSTSIVSRNAIIKEKNEYLNVKLLQAKNQVDLYLSNFSHISEWVSEDKTIKNAIKESSPESPLNLSPDFEYMVNKFTLSMSQNEQILNFGVGVIAEDIVYLQDGTPLGDGYSLRRSPLYGSVETGKTVITQPYIDAATGKLCVSISTPIKSDGVIYGISFVDVDLEAISLMFSELSFGKTGRVILISENDTIMAYQNLDLTGKLFSNVGFSGASLERELANPTGELFDYKLNGENKRAIMMKLPTYNWKLMVGVSNMEYNKDITVIILILNILILIGLIFSLISIKFYMFKKLSPISQLNSGLMEMSKGNLSIDIKYESDDEIGEMANSMRSCLTTLSKYIDEIGKSMIAFSEGDLTVKPNADFKGDFKQIKSSIDLFSFKINSLLYNINDSANRVSVGSNQISEGSQTLANGATEQAYSIEQLAENMSEISTQIKVTSDNVKEAKEQTDLASDALILCNNEMQEAVLSMEKINESSSQIIDIIQTIEDIAFQTNILAINAATEATRAGVAGKGFAVVAGEVRSLASKSAEASKVTSELIEASLKAVKDGTKVIKRTSESLGKVIKNTDSSKILVDKISDAAEEQSNSVSHINSGIEKISSVVQTNTATAEESAASCKNLSFEAENLHKMVSQFKLQSSENFSVDMSSDYTYDVKDIDNISSHTVENYNNKLDSHDKY